LKQTSFSVAVFGICIRPEFLCKICSNKNIDQIRDHKMTRYGPEKAHGARAELDLSLKLLISFVVGLGQSARTLIGTRVFPL
jgi:hypothetical protein